MEIIVTIFAFLVGVSIGSFLNVLILRFNTGRGFSGRSFCFTCARTLGPAELVPVFSFLLQKGRCKGCQSKISIQYPLVELLTGILFALVAFYNFSIMDSVGVMAGYSLIGLMLMFMFVAVFVYDMKHKIIPDKFVLAIIIIGISKIVLDMIFYNLDWTFAVYRMIGAVAVYVPFWALWHFSGGRLIGLGDGKLAFALAVFFPFYLTVSALVLAFWIGALFSIFLIIASKTKGKYNLKSAIPFGPFIIIGAIIVYFYNIDLLNIVLLREYLIYVL